MSKSLIQTANPSQQTLAVGSVISLGSVLRRFGCNCRLNGNAIEVEGEGYYTIDVSVTASPTEVGTVTIGIYQNGVIIPGTLISESVSTAGNPVTLSVPTTIRQRCCDSASSITVVLVAGAGVVNNISVRVVKE